MSKFTSSLLTIAAFTCLGLQLYPAHGETITAPNGAVVTTQTPEALKKTAETAIRNKDWLLAIQLWDSYSAQNPDDAYGHRRRGDVLLEIKRFDEAIAAFTRAVELDPKNVIRWNSLCWAQIVANQTLQARSNCQKAVELKNTNYAALVNLGHTYLLQGETSTAQTYYKKTLTNISTKSELNNGPIDDLNLFIKNGWQVQASTQAKAWFEKEGAIRLAQIQAADQLNSLAGIAQYEKNYAQAVELTEKRLSLFIELFGEDHPRVNDARISVVSALNYYAKDFHDKAQYQTSEPLFVKALGISEKANGAEHSDTVMILNGLASLYKSMGQYTKAEPIYIRALAISEKTKGVNHVITSVALNNLAILYEFMGQYAKAEPLYIRALAISEKINGAEDSMNGSVLNNLAVLYKSMGQYAKAESQYIRALAISEKTNGAEHPRTGTSLNNLALLYKSLGQYAKAVPMYIRALAISEKAEGAEHPSTGIQLNNLAGLYESMGQYAKAEPMYIRALAISEKAEGAEHPETAGKLNNLGGLYRSKGQYIKAEPLFIRALAISEKVNGAEHPNTGISLSHLAVLYTSMGQYTKAEPMYLRALAISEKAEGAEHANTGINLNNLALLYESMGQPTKAEPLYLHAYRIANAAGVPELSWTVQDNLSDFYTQSQPNLAIWYGKQAINTLQTVRAGNTALDKETQKSFLEKNESRYKSLADLLFAQGRLMEGQQVLAMLKESEYFDFLQRNSATDPRQTQSNFTEQERPWSERYGKISSQLASIGKERELLLKKSKETSAAGSLNADDQARKDKLDADMAVARQAYAAFMVELKQEFSKSASAERQQEFGEKNLSSLRALQGTLRDLGHGAVTLHYLMTDKRLWILLTTPTVQLKRESTISEAELNKLIGQYREAIANRSPNIKTLGKALYDILLGPVAEDLKQADAKTLMLSLDGSLRYLPMAALYDGEQYLAKRYSLALYTSAAKDKLKDKPQANWTLAGYGLTQKHEGFNALPAVKGELDGIMEGMKGQVKFDNDFTAKAFKAGLESEPSVVHLASHFVFAPGNETDSYLLLGDGKKLSLKEIKDGYEFVNLDLLTLSACETAVGGGKDANGREVEGFGALAQNQGAKGVIATLWPVADQSTGQFMQLLYGYRQQNPGMTKAQAMQKAQLAFIEGKVEPALAAVSRGAPKIAATPAPVTTTDHPYYWAPFILMGNWL
jgi:CHAT domain-containing protein/tetratricopeptide (TPR) repeat protein